jgi:hypothetical protein
VETRVSPGGMSATVVRRQNPKVLMVAAVAAVVVAVGTEVAAVEVAVGTEAVAAAAEEASGEAGGAEAPTPTVNASREEAGRISSGFRRHAATVFFTNLLFRLGRNWNKQLLFHPTLDWVGVSPAVDR